MSPIQTSILKNICGGLPIFPYFSGQFSCRRVLSYNVNKKSRQAEISREGKGIRGKPFITMQKDNDSDLIRSGGGRHRWRDGRIVPSAERRMQVATIPKSSL